MDSRRNSDEDELEQGVEGEVTRRQPRQEVKLPEGVHTLATCSYEGVTAGSEQRSVGARDQDFGGHWSGEAATTL